MPDEERAILWRWDLPIVVVALAAAAAVMSVELTHDVEYAAPPAVVAPFGVFVAVILLWRRKFPVMVGILTAAGAVVGLALHSHVAVIGVLVGTYTVARYGQRWVAAVIAIATAADTTMATAWAVDLRTALVTSTWMIGWLALCVIGGEVMWQQNLRLCRANDRAAQAERSREELARHRADEERVRIARELHDSLTHSISVVNVQSSVALHVLARQPAQAEEALRHIRAAGQDAMRELRATLRALRVADTDKSPGTSGLATLVGRIAAEERSIDLSIDDAMPLLPDAVDRTVYRIVQEALTNVARHSDADRVAVSVRHGGDLVTVRVTDNGSIDTVPDEGLGLLGMRERVTALGGRLRYGIAPAGIGFEITAELPIMDEVGRERDDPGTAGR